MHTDLNHYCTDRPSYTGCMSNCIDIAKSVRLFIIQFQLRKSSYSLAGGSTSVVSLTPLPWHQGGYCEQVS